MPKDLERAIQPFKCLSDTRTSGLGGFGLGLAIVAAVAKGHGASLHVTTDSTGVVVKLLFPTTRASL